MYKRFLIRGLVIMQLTVSEMPRDIRVNTMIGYTHSDKFSLGYLLESVIVKLLLLTWVLILRVIKERDRSC